MEVTDFSGGIRVNSRCDQNVLGAMGYSVAENFLRVSGVFERKVSDYPGTVSGGFWDWPRIVS